MRKLKSLLKNIYGVRALAEFIRINFIAVYKSYGLKDCILHNIVLIISFLQFNINKKSYQILAERELLKTRTSDKAFVFGSGYSLNQISDDQWRHFEQHNTIGFSGFNYQKWVRTDYHLIRGWMESKEGVFNWRKHIWEYADILNRNPLFDDAVLIMQGDYRAQFCNQLLGHNFINKGKRIYRFKTVRNLGLPTESLKEGLRHGRATLCDAVNFAFCMGWKEIVLVGVDLYDSRYFWVPPDKTLNFDKATGRFIQDTVTPRGIKYNETHNTVNNGIIEEMKEWNGFFKKRGVRMSVYNPKSLLTQVLPVYELVKQS